ncbi:MAG: hypothetical protein OXT74_19340 [Candidatus Poribacteria bacterium]|nr:hypothetical protein [Candidatus Poribacteria bacterium]
MSEVRLSRENETRLVQICKTMDMDLERLSVGLGNLKEANRDKEIIEQLKQSIITYLTEVCKIDISDDESLAKEYNLVI